MLDLTRALVTEPHIITRTFYASPDPFSQDKVGLDIYNIYISTYLHIYNINVQVGEVWAASPLGSYPQLRTSVLLISSTPHTAVQVNTK